MAENNEDESWSDIELEATEDTPTLPPSARKGAHVLLPQAMIENAIGLPGIDQIKTAKSFCLVVQVPSPDWVAPVHQYLKLLGGREWNFNKSKSSTPRSSAQPDEISIDQTTRALAMGGRCLGVSHQLSLLPGAMVSAADLTLALPHPNARVVNAVIKAVTGRMPRGLEERTVSVLDFGEIATSIRAGSSAKACVERLRAAAVRKVRPNSSVDEAPLLEDLHGYGAAKLWCLELVEDLEAWRRGEIPWSAVSSNVVLAGAPGVGKTSLMKSLARSAGVPLIATSVGAWFANSPGFLDSVIKEIDAVFAAARSQSPAILLLDELDAVPNRATISPRGADWWLPVIGHILTTLDGAISGATENLIVIGATNHPEKLDAALVRPGRLARIIEIERPDEAALAGIFRQHLGTDLLGEDLSQIAAMSLGSTGASVVEFVKTARRRARAAKRPVLIVDLLAAVAPVDERSFELIRRVAVHEAGHAAVAHWNGIGRILGISIVAFGDKGGFAIIDNDGRLPTREHVEKDIMQRLGGRAAEEVLLGYPGTGSGGSPYSDLAVATRQMALLHLGLGLGESLVYRADEAGVDQILSFDARMTGIVDKELQLLYADTVAIVKSQINLIEALAEDLILRRHIGPARFLEIVDRVLHASPVKENANA